MYRILFTALMFVGVVTVSAQEQDMPGPHERQEVMKPGAQPQHTYVSSALRKSEGRMLTHKVMGYHPYWRSDDNIANYRFDLLSHVVYFSVGVDPNTGQVTTTRDWMTTPLIEAAHSAGCRVHLCVTNFGSANNLQLLQNSEARDTLIAQLIRLVAERGGDGINLDFESMPAAARDDFVAFCSDLDRKLAQEIPGAEISSAMPAVDWSDAWDVAELAKYIDLFFLMCYDYYWSGSSYAGPVSPIQGSAYNVTRTVDWYLGQGVPKEQLLLGVPYYGIDWPVVSDQPNAATQSKGTAYIYTSVQNGLKLYDRLWSETFLNPWYSYQIGSTWHQAWYDDVESLGHKYELTLDRDLAGIGIWALSYDNGYDELWQLIEDTFTAPVSVHAPGANEAFSLSPVYPNPVVPGTAAIHVAYHLPLPRAAITMRVVDILGRLVYDRRYVGNSPSGNISVPTHNLVPGMYRLIAETEGSVFLRTFIVSR